MLSTTRISAILGLIAMASLPGSASPTRLFASSYDGNVYTLELADDSLDVLSATTRCQPEPAWLTLDSANSALYCLSEGWSVPNGSLTTFTTAPDGSLTVIDKVDTISGPVSSVIYGDGEKALAIAHYGGSSVSSFSLSSLDELQSETWTGPLGPNLDRQDRPHPHEAILDPTGRFLIVPDLGSDLVRVMFIDEGLGLTEVDPLVAKPGSGPRHVDFLSTDEGKTFMYLVAEIANTVTVYEVSYLSDGRSLEFSEIMVTGTRGDVPTPNGAAAEVHMSPDKRFLVVSNRFDQAFQIADFENEGAEIPSDTLTTFSVDHSTGAITAVQLYPAGGLTPRHFSFNKDGSLVGSALQQDGRVVVISRNVESGLLGDFVGHVKFAANGVNCVIFDE